MSRNTKRKMGKGDQFAFVAGIIALVTSTIQLVVEILKQSAGLPVVNTSIQVDLTSSKMLVGFGLGYGWFLICWVLLRRIAERLSWSFSEPKGMVILAGLVVAGTGIFLIPIWLLLDGITGVLFQFAIALGIFVALPILMLVVYADKLK